VAAFVGTAVSGVGGAIAFKLFHSSTTSMFATWQDWVTSDALGIIAVAPLVIEFASAARARLSRSELIEGVLAVAALALMSGFAIFLRSELVATVVPIALLFPPLLWLAARCRPVFAATAAFVVSLLVVWTTTFSVGYFGNPVLPIAERVLAAQASILLVTLGALVLASLFAEIRDKSRLLAEASQHKSQFLANMRSACRSRCESAGTYRCGPGFSAPDRIWAIGPLHRAPKGSISANPSKNTTSPWCWRSQPFLSRSSRPSTVVAAGPGPISRWLAISSSRLVRRFSCRRSRSSGWCRISGGTWNLPRLVGNARALGLTLLGNKLPAEQAAAWGMIWQCVDDAELESAVQALAEQFAVARTRGLAATKTAIRGSWRHSLEEATRHRAGLAGRTWAVGGLCRGGSRPSPANEHRTFWGIDP